jgi:hypothetical protein
MASVRSIQKSNTRAYVLAAEAMEKVRDAGGSAEMQVSAFNAALAKFSDPVELERFDNMLEWQVMMETMQRRQDKQQQTPQTADKQEKKQK